MEQILRISELLSLVLRNNWFFPLLYIWVDPLKYEGSIGIMLYWCNLLIAKLKHHLKVNPSRKSLTKITL